MPIIVLQVSSQSFKPTIIVLQVLPPTFESSHQRLLHSPGIVLKYLPLIFQHFHQTPASPLMPTTVLPQTFHPANNSPDNNHQPYNLLIIVLSPTSQPALHNPARFAPIFHPALQAPSSLPPGHQVCCSHDARRTWTPAKIAEHGHHPRHQEQRTYSGSKGAQWGGISGACRQTGNNLDYGGSCLVEI